MSDSYHVGYLPRAAKALAELPLPVQRRVATRVNELAAAPRGPGVVKLKGSETPPIYRVRIGRDYRVLFTIDDATRTVAVVTVGPRKDVYRRR